MVQVICLIVRFIYVVHTNTTFRIPHPFKKFVLKGTEAQNDAGVALYRLALCSEDIPEDSILLQHLHRLMSALICTSDLSDDILACPTDQLLFGACSWHLFVTMAPIPQPEM
jgi:hypothetical protein